MGQMGFFDVSKRYAGLDAKADPLVKLNAMVPWDAFRPRLEPVWRRRAVWLNGGSGGLGQTFTARNRYDRRSEMAEQMEGPVRLGVVLPSVNTVVEPWFSRVVPEGVNVHAARMLIPPKLTPAGIIEMDRNEGMSAVRQLSDCRLDVVAYCCTASSVVQGQAYDAHLRHEIEVETGARATSATHALLSAIAALGGRRMSVVSPYTEEVDTLDRQFFEQAGLHVVSSAHLGIEDVRARDADRRGPAGSGAARLVRGRGYPRHHLPQHAFGARGGDHRSGDRQAGRHLHHRHPMAHAAPRRLQGQHTRIRPPPRLGLKRIRLPVADRPGTSVIAR